MQDLDKSWEKVVHNGAIERDLAPDLERVFLSRAYVQNIRYSPLMASACLEIEGGLEVFVTATDPDRPESFDVLFYDSAHEDNPVHGATVLSYEELQGAVDGFVQGRAAALGRGLAANTGENQRGLRALKIALGLTAAIAAGAALYEGGSDQNATPQNNTHPQNNIIPLAPPAIEDMF